MKSHHASIVSALFACGLFALATPGAFAGPQQARVDIATSASSPMNLEIVDASDQARADWPQGDMGKIVAHFPATDQWRTGSITVKPQQSGRISMMLLAPWSRLDGATRLLEVVRVDYDDVRVTGASLHNGGFEETFSSGQLRHWYASDVADSNPPVSDDNRARLVHGNAAEGLKFVRVWHNSRFGQSFDVAAGVPVTITFSYRAAR